MKALAFLTSAFLLGTSLLAGSFFLAEAVYLSPGAGNLPAGKSLVLEIDKKKKNKKSGGASGNKPKQDDAGTASGERSCPVGYVVLDKPNKFGSFCEAKEGVCPKGMAGTPPNCSCPADTVPSGKADQPCIGKVACPFKGQVGSPPNCECPKGTEFFGYSGCVKYTVDATCADVPYPEGITPYVQKCQQAGGKAQPSPIQRKYEPNEKAYVTECCAVRRYEK